jgi:hypothetical protein
MSSGSENPYAPPAESSLPSFSTGGAGSLAQSARLKELKSARRILFVLGGLLIVFCGIAFPFVNEFVRAQLDEEARQLTQKGMVINQAKLTEIKEAQVRAVQIGLLAQIGIGVLYVVLGLLVNKFPVPATVTALVVYIGVNVAVAVHDSSQLATGWWIKLIVVIALAKAVQAAIAYQKTVDSQAQSGFAGFSG